MRRLRCAAGIVASALGVAVVASACSVANPTAIEVNGTSKISRSQFLAEVDAFLSDPSIGALVGCTGKQGTGDTKPTSYSTDCTANVATIDVLSLIYEAEMKRRNIEPTPADTQQAQKQLDKQSQGQDASGSGPKLVPEPGSPAAQARKRLEGYLADKYALLRLVGPSPEQLEVKARQLYESELPRLQQTCIQEIVVLASNDPAVLQGTKQPTPDETAAAKAKTDAVMAQLAGGASFADVGNATNPADIPVESGCGDPAEIKQPELVSAVQTTPVGQTSQPVDLGVAFVIVKVTDRRAQPFDDLKDTLIQQVQQTESRSVLADMDTRLLAAAVVSIDPLFGQWNSAAGKVDPPGGASPAPPLLSPGTAVPPLPSAGGPVGGPPAPSAPAASSEPTSSTSASSTPAGSTSSTPPSSAAASSTATGRSGG